MWSIFDSFLWLIGLITVSLSFLLIGALVFFAIMEWLESLDRPMNQPMYELLAQQQFEMNMAALEKRQRNKFVNRISKYYSNLDN